MEMTKLILCFKQIVKIDNLKKKQARSVSLERETARVLRCPGGQIRRAMVISKQNTGVSTCISN